MTDPDATVEARSWTVAFSRRNLAQRAGRTHGNPGAAGGRAGRLAFGAETKVFAAT